MAWAGGRDIEGGSLDNESADRCRSRTPHGRSNLHLHPEPKLQPGPRWTPEFDPRGLSSAPLCTALLCPDRFTAPGKFLSKLKIGTPRKEEVKVTPDQDGATAAEGHASGWWHMLPWEEGNSQERSWRSVSEDIALSKGSPGCCHVCSGFPRARATFPGKKPICSYAPYAHLGLILRCSCLTRCGIAHCDPSNRQHCTDSIASSLHWRANPA